MYNIRRSTAFKKDIKVSKKRCLDMKKLKTVIEILAKGQSLPSKNNDHKLTGNWKGYRECHVEPDWLLVYCITEKEVQLIRTGSHSDLFRT